MEDNKIPEVHFFTALWAEENKREKVKVKTTPEYIGIPDHLRKEELVFVTFFRERNFVKTQVQLTFFMFASCISDKHFIIQLIHKYIIRRYN
jgi:hypothetical protein